VTSELTLLSRVAYRGQEITSPRLRGLLALLAGDLRTGASAGRLVEGLWPDGQPEHPAKALQVVVSRARAQLGADVIASTPTGYRLALGEDQVDAAAVLRSAAASVRCAQAGDHAAALAHAEAGLAQWDGAPGGDDRLDDPVAALRAERASTWRSLVRARALALARLGRHAEAAGPLAELAAERPRDEEVLGELLRGEAATEGPSAALARYEAYRRSLRDELGTDPGPALQAVHRQLLQGTAPAVRHGVAHEPNPLLGRDDDVAAVAGLLRSSRVTSIVGPGGLGKTRLAQVVSRQAEQRIVHFVALAGVASDDDVVGEVASVLGTGEARRTPAGQRAAPAGLLAGIVGTLGPGPALLVLDNCEHVLGGAAELVGALVSMTRDLAVLTTSRAPLGLSSESVYLLPELSLATAVELFTQRARAARPGADLPADAVAEVCRHLDGLPLAVELAAARVRAMSVAEIARRLDDRFGLLRGGPATPPSGTRPCRPWSTGAGTCSSRPGGRPCGPCRSSPPGSPPTPPGGCWAAATPPTSGRPWRAWSTSRCSRWRTPRRARASGCWRRCGSSARPTGRRPPRPSSWSAGSWPGPATSGWPITGRRSGPIRSRRWTGSGPSRTTSPRRSATGWPGRTAAPWRRPARCSGAYGTSSPTTRA
jgi:DNA-binding SARP family transcriptional activator